MTSLLVRDPFLASPFRLMDEFMRSAGNGKGVTGFSPPVDVHETDEEYWVRIDLPGVKADDVNVEVNDNVLSIVGSRVPAETGAAQILERSYGAFARTLTLPKGVDSDAIEAAYQDGVLELRIPKPAERKPKKIAIGASTRKTIEK